MRHLPLMNLAAMGIALAATVGEGDGALAAPVGSAPPGAVSPPAPPAPPPPLRPLKAKGALVDLISIDFDYPAAAIRAGEQGDVGFRLDVGPNGRVARCTVMESSGSAILDSATCRMLTQRARFTPATDASATPIEASVTGAIQWRLSAVTPQP
jgi:protein TonB